MHAAHETISYPLPLDEALLSEAGVRQADAVQTQQLLGGRDNPREAFLKKVAQQYYQPQ